MATEFEQLPAAEPEGRQPGPHGSPLQKVAAVLVPLAVVGGLYLSRSVGGHTVVDDGVPVVLVAPPGADPAVVTLSDAATSTDSQAVMGDGCAAAEAASDIPDDVDDPAPVFPPPPPIIRESFSDGEVVPIGTVSPRPELSAPGELDRGAFVGLDGHRAAGEAISFRLRNRTQVVRLQGLDLEPVRGATVHVVPSGDATALVEGSVLLGRLRSNVGNHNYAVPREADLSTGRWTVLVWCESSATAVGAASL